MANQKNCPNCGAPYDPSLSKCPYCGTIYFDMSVIDFDHHEPFWLKIRVNGCEITQFVVPEMGNIKIEQDNTVASGRYGEPLFVAWNKTEITTDISFHAICPPDSGALVTMMKL